MPSARNLSEARFANLRHVLISRTIFYSRTSVHSVFCEDLYKPVSSSAVKDRLIWIGTDRTEYDYCDVLVHVENLQMQDLIVMSGVLNQSGLPERQYNQLEWLQHTRHIPTSANGCIPCDWLSSRNPACYITYFIVHTVHMTWQLTASW